MSELHPEYARKVSATALAFIGQFLGQQFGDEHAQPFDRRHLGVALDWVEELSAMVMNLADRADTLAQRDAEIARLRADAERFDFGSHLERQRKWSEQTFGPGARAKGVVEHIRKELREIEADPSDLIEWIDVAILALDGAWRSGATPAQIIAALVAKQTKNEGRKWPDWRTVPPDTAIEHDRKSEWPASGDLVRYGDGSTALAVLTSPHAGGWHGKQCMGGSTFVSRRLHRPSRKDMETWLECDKYRHGQFAADDERIRATLAAIAAQPTGPEAV